jgi:hypothetical protein
MIARERPILCKSAHNLIASGVGHSLIEDHTVNASSRTHPKMKSDKMRLLKKYLNCIARSKHDDLDYIEKHHGAKADLKDVDSRSKPKALSCQDIKHALI